MRILNLGSLNIDRAYSVDHFVAAGETLSAASMEVFSGGKGLNQSVALARAGAEVVHGGAIGSDGLFLKEQLEQSGADTRFLQVTEFPTGHAVIQLTPEGKNCILICAGANGEISREYVDSLLAEFGSGDLLLVQNETSNAAYAIRQAKNKGMRVALNASPVDGRLLEYPLEAVDYFLVNEIEGACLAGMDPREDPEKILEQMRRSYPNAVTVLTLGERGVVCAAGETTLRRGIYKVNTVDTTAAGDTFCGYFLAGVAAGSSLEDCLRQASLASALAVTAKGAAPSIPTKQQVEQFEARISGGGEAAEI